MDGGDWWTTVHDVAQSRTRLSSFTFTFPFHALEKEMQPTPVFLPGESQGREPGGLLFVGLHRVGHDCSNLAAAAAAAFLLKTISSGNTLHYSCLGNPMDRGA